MKFGLKHVPNQGKQVQTSINMKQIDLNKYQEEAIVH